MFGHSVSRSSLSSRLSDYNLPALTRFVGQEIDRHQPNERFAKSPFSFRKEITDCEVYEFVEIVP